jgi:hypothetical protein
MLPGSINGPIRVDTDFEGASLTVERITGTTVIARLRHEAVCRADGGVYDYNRHFAFGIENLSGADIDAEILIGCASADDLPDTPALLFTADSPNDEFSRTDVWSRADAHKAYAIRVRLSSGQRRYFANYLFRPYRFLTLLFDRLGRAGGAERGVIGRSVESRDLVRYSYTRPATAKGVRPAMLVTSGVHPPEPDTLATEAIMEYLATAQSERLRDTFDVHVVPVMNPDGFVHGYNGCNANEINFYWLFDRHDQVRCPEAHALWALAEHVRPVVYFDWHGYTFQRGAKHAAPYVKPVILHSGARVRRLVRTLNSRVQKVADGHRTTGFLTYAPSTLATQLTLAFNTITYAKYHLELRLGEARNRRLAIETLEAVLDTMIDAGIRDARSILKRPYGNIRPDPVARVAQRLVFWWGGHARPTLGRLRRRFAGPSSSVAESPV